MTILTSEEKQLKAIKKTNFQNKHLTVCLENLKIKVIPIIFLVSLKLMVFVDNLSAYTANKVLK